MSLHYLVKLEMFIAHVLPLNCYRKKPRNFFHPNSSFMVKASCCP